jgi:hypothetical protein
MQYSPIHQVSDAIGQYVCCKFPERKTHVEGTSAAFTSSLQCLAGLAVVEVCHVDHHVEKGFESSKIIDSMCTDEP